MMIFGGTSREAPRRDGNRGARLLAALRLANPTRRAASDEFSEQLQGVNGEPGQAGERDED
jgi:hypothetical protein